MAKLKVLIVDDEPAILRALGRTLNTQFDVMAVGSGEEALHLLEQHKFDVMLTDQLMPVMTGSALVKEVQNRGIALPCIMLTGFADVEAAEKDRAGENIFAVMGKPWNKTALLETVMSAGLSLTKRNMVIK